MTWGSIGLVASREIRERGRSKAFIGSTVFTLLLLIGVIVIPSLFAGRPLVHEMGVVGEGNAAIVEAARELLAPPPGEEDPRPVSIEVTELDSEEEGRRALLEGELDLVLVGGSRILTDEAGGFFGGDSLAGTLQQAASSLMVAELVSQGGRPAQQVIEMLTAQPLEVESLAGIDEEEQGQRALIAYGGLILMYMAILSYAIYTLTGVTEEKTSRVVEVLLAALKPWQLLAGKIIGIGVLGLGQVIVTVAVALAAVQVTGLVDLPAVPLDSAATLVGWFVLGYALYAVGFGAAGALVSRMEDAQNASGPLTIVALVGFFASFYVLDNPDTLVAQIFSYIPFTAPYVVPIRTALDAIAPWEVGAAVATTLAAIAGLVRFAGRVYAGGVLQFGARVKLLDAYRSAES